MARVVIVLGMHRSGTSVLARALPALGVSLGDLSESHGADNPTGFWEHQDVKALNERLLAALGSRWDSLATIPTGRWTSPAVAELSAEAGALIERAFAGQALWGFKDPRTARVLPFWQRVLRERGHEDLYVIAYRHPASVARSLASRNGLEAQHAHVLWLLHVLPAIVQTRGRPRVVVDYDDLIQQPAPQLRRIGAALGLAVPPDDGDAMRAFRAFVAAELRHHHAGEADDDGPLPGPVRRAHRWLRRMARDEIAVTDPATEAGWSALADWIDELAPVWTALEGGRGAGPQGEAARALERLTSDHERLRREHAGLRGEHETLRREHETLRGEHQTQLQRLDRVSVQMVHRLDRALERRPLARRALRWAALKVRGRLGGS